MAKIFASGPEVGILGRISVSPLEHNAYKMLLAQDMIKKLLLNPSAWKHEKRG